MIVFLSLLKTNCGCGPLRVSCEGGGFGSSQVADRCSELVTGLNADKSIATIVSCQKSLNIFVVPVADEPTP